MFKPKSIYCKYAFDIICGFIKTGIKEFNEEYISIPELQQRKGCFVSIHENGALRGCIGTIVSYRESLFVEIMENAIAAATKDPRFRPVGEWELEQIDLSVDILSEPEKIESVNELDHKKYGVIVAKGVRKGVLLPNLEGVNSWREQLAIAKSKAGLSDTPNEELEIYRFSSERYY